MIREVYCVDTSKHHHDESGENLNKATVYFIDDSYFKGNGNTLAVCYRRYQDDDVIYSGKFFTKRFKIAK